MTPTSFPRPATLILLITALAECGGAFGPAPELRVLVVIAAVLAIATLFGRGGGGTPPPATQLESQP